jgi:predicted O-methyltransferase YrrM
MAAPRHRPHDPTEFQRLLEWIQGKESLLEIGSRFGYPLVEMAHVLKPGAKVVSVDLPDAEGWNPPLNTLNHLRRNVEQLQTEGYKAHLVVGDSHSQNIIRQVKELGPFEVIFIDGDHTYKGVVDDWINYGPLGQIIIFHDIRRPVPPEDMNVEVWKLWEEIRMWANTEKKFPFEEYIAPGSRMGIARINLGTPVSDHPG